MRGRVGEWPGCGRAVLTGAARPPRVAVFRNDNWPPRAPPPELPAPSFVSPETALLRALPAPSFVSPRVADKGVIAASAVAVADWFADVVWALYVGPTQGTVGANSGLGGADKAPQPLAAFVHAVLSQTLASPQCAALGLYYLVRLPVRLASAAPRPSALWVVGSDDGHTTYASVPDRERTARAAFVAELYLADDVPYRLAALALMLGNKWLDDHTFTNKTWCVLACHVMALTRCRHQVTRLDLARLTALEQRALECFGHSLAVPDHDWRAWLAVLKEGAHAALAITCSPVSALAIHAMDRMEADLDLLPAGVGAGIPDVDLDEQEMHQVEIDIDLDDGGPVPDELRRPVKVRLQKPSDGDEWDRALEAAAAEHAWLMGIVDEDQYAHDRIARDYPDWDCARDPPVTRSRPLLDPVQRPRLKNKPKHVPRVELYDARLHYPHDYNPVLYPHRADPWMRAGVC